MDSFERFLTFQLVMRMPYSMEKLFIPLVLYTWSWHEVYKTYSSQKKKKKRYTKHKSLTLLFINFIFNQGRFRPISGIQNINH